MQVSKDFLLVVIGVLLLLTMTVIAVMLFSQNRFSITTKKENTIVDTTKLNTINDSILFHKNVLVIYRDSLNNEVKKIDYISNDSAIKLFKELINE